MNNARSLIVMVTKNICISSILEIWQECSSCFVVITFLLIIQSIKIMIELQIILEISLILKHCYFKFID